MVKLGLVVPTLTQHQMALEMIESFDTQFDVEFFPICNWRHGFSVSKSWNEGINKAIHKGCHLIFVANDDIIVSEYAVDEMVITMFEQRDLAVLTGRDYRNQFTVDEVRSLKLNFGLYDDKFSVVTDYAFFVIRANAFYDIGPFDETFAPAYFEDNDYHYRIELDPYWRSVQHKGAAFYHYGSKTQFADPKYPICEGTQFERNKSYYEKKWGGVPGHEKFTEPFGGTIVDTGIGL